MAKGKSPVADHAQQKIQETSLEAESRKIAGFDDIEKVLPKRWAVSEMGFLDKLTGRLGRRNPFYKPATPDKNIVTLLDTIAYRPVHPYPHSPQPWQAEFVAAIFYKGRKDVGDVVSTIADAIGLDGDVGSNAEAKARIAERIQPFIDEIAPAKSVEIAIPQTSGVPIGKMLGPSNASGITSQTELTGGNDRSDGTNIVFTAPAFPEAKAHIHYAAPEGWGIISDVDDTIKVTQTTNPIGILKTTFADEPQPIAGMAELYKVVHDQFNNPVWFYLSASPYNLYPFLHEFIRTHYQPGQLILRDNSWMFLGGLLQSLTQGTQAYKVDRLEKIHRWLPKRKFICVGDSTQSDPESYAEMYRKYPKGWIRAIYIRKVTDVSHMEKKNEQARFDKAFEGVPRQVWKIFERPQEIEEHLRTLAGEA
ncbi:hypothetical protein GJ744_004698 [Endocarpon pusillum]|uniref:Phosphatidate phosphatase APP1 catalytic domain-containing protein n=1 Tax=Endocarpon pusillum TaxID=364733 RepID=A0A8H7AD46_9EURO|nr:hypothetical protein GJ744_004698 [Endocarpon pusillum]